MVGRRNSGQEDTVDDNEAFNNMEDSARSANILVSDTVTTITSMTESEMGEGLSQQKREWVEDWIPEPAIHDPSFEGIPENLDFLHLRFIAERSLISSGTEILFTVLIPERPGTFRQLISAIIPRPITEFSYRYNDPDTAAVYVSFAVADLKKEKMEVTKAWDAMGFQWEDISGDELAKSHGRYLVGGIGGDEERLYRFKFPERQGALQKFVLELRPGWNISLLHYRNHGHGT